MTVNIQVKMRSMVKVEQALLKSIALTKVIEFFYVLERGILHDYH